MVPAALDELTGDDVTTRRIDHAMAHLAILDISDLGGRRHWLPIDPVPDAIDAHGVLIADHFQRPRRLRLTIAGRRWIVDAILAKLVGEAIAHPRERLRQIAARLLIVDQSVAQIDIEPIHLTG